MAPKEAADRHDRGYDSGLAVNPCDGGPISNATLGLADALTTDSVGNLYIADTGLIRKINWKAGTIATIAGGGTSAMNGVPGVQFSLSRPGGLVFDGAGNLWIADAGSHRLFVVSAGLIQTVAGTSANGDGGPATNALLPDPSGIAVNAQNDLYISAGGSIRFVNHTTGLISVPAVISYLGPLPGSIAGAVQANIQIPTSIPAGASSLFMTGPTGRGNNYSSLAIPIYMQTALP